LQHHLRQPHTIGITCALPGQSVTTVKALPRDYPLREWGSTPIGNRRG
jgi:hypothetical protein